MKTKLATVLIANTKQKFLQRRISTFVTLSVLKSQADKVQFEHTVLRMSKFRYVLKKRLPWLILKASV